MRVIKFSLIPVSDAEEGAVTELIETITSRVGANPIVQSIEVKSTSASRGNTKGAAILAEIHRAVASSDGLPSRKEIAEKCQCTVSRVAEILKANAADPAVVEYVAGTKKPPAAKKAKAAEPVAESAVA